MTKYSDLNEIFMAIWQDFKPQIPFFVYFMGKVFQLQNKKNIIIIIIIVSSSSLL